MERISRLLTDNIVFPELGISLYIDKEAFSVFGLSIKWYGVMIALGLLLAAVYCFRRTKEFGVESDRLTDAALAGGIGAVIGARLYYVALHSESFHDIRDVLAIRDGGLAIYGGIIGALLFGCIAAKLRHLRILPTLDIAAMGFLIGQSVGRWGNFFNQEAFGTNTSLPWGMSGGRIQNYLIAQSDSLAARGIDVDPFLPVHPCFLYESLWCALGFLLLHIFHKRRKFDGEVFCLYVFWYGLGRTFIEGLRTDSLYIGEIRASQLLAALSAAAALAVIVAMRIRVSKRDVLLYRDSEESKALILQAENAEKQAYEQRQAKKAKRTELTSEQRIISDEEDDGDNEPDSGSPDNKEVM